MDITTMISQVKLGKKSRNGLFGFKCVIVFILETTAQMISRPQLESSPVRQNHLPKHNTSAEHQRRVTASRRSNIQLVVQVPSP